MTPVPNIKTTIHIFCLASTILTTLRVKNIAFLPNWEKLRFNHLMRIISRQRLLESWESHLDAEQPLRAWYAEAKGATWKSPAEIKTIFQGARILPGNRIDATTT